MYVEVGAWSETPAPPGSVVVGYNGRSHSREAVAWAVRAYATLSAQPAATETAAASKPLMRVRSLSSRNIVTGSISATHISATVAEPAMRYLAQWEPRPIGPAVRTERAWLAPGSD